MSSQWDKAPLEELTEDNSPITYGVVKPGAVGDVLFVRGGDLSNGRILHEQLRTITKEISNQYKRTLLRGGELLVSLVGQPGQVAVVPPALAGANIARQVGLVRLRSGIDANFISYFLQSPDGRKALGTYTGGSVQQVINLRDLRTVDVPIPPLHEQKQIVEIVDEAFEGIDRAIVNTEKNLTNARELFESHLNDIFTPKDNKWEWVKLSEITTNITDGSHQPPPKSQFGIPFITISNINKESRQVDFSNTFKVSEEYFEKLKDSWKPRKGDLLYTVTGSYGIPVVIDYDVDFCFQRHIGLIRPNGETNPRCLYYILLSRHLLNQAHECATGTAQKTVSLNALRRFSVPKIPKKEQEILVARLDILSEKICRLEVIYRQKLAALNELKQSILQKAFTGELTSNTPQQATETAKEVVAA